MTGYIERECGFYVAAFYPLVVLIGVTLALAFYHLRQADKRIRELAEDLRRCERERLYLETELDLTRTMR